VSQARRRAVFLDRDGTINQEVGYISQVKDLRLIDGAARAIAELNRAGLAVIVVSNQSGLARGYFSLEQMLAVQAELERRLAREGARLDGFYYCPHHPRGKVERLAIECGCRKPKPGLVLQAAQDHGLELAGSYMVGDRWRDAACGQAVGLTTILVATGHGGQPPAGDREPDYRAADLAAAVRWILTRAGENRHA